jgi:membrane-associated phospholipid phosphatase
MNFDWFDLPILRFLTGFVGKSPLFDHFVHAISRYHTFKGVIIMSLLVYLWFREVPDGHEPLRSKGREALLRVLAGSIAIVTLSRILQLALQVHQRPIVAGLGLNFPSFMAAEWVGSFTWNSFPSDHSMLFFSLSTGLWMIDRRIGVFCFIWSALVIDLPRVYLGIHYPSDVVAGAALGVLCMIGWMRLPLGKFADHALAWGGRHRAIFYWLAFMVVEQVARLFDDIRDVVGTSLKHLS